MRRRNYLMLGGAVIIVLALVLSSLPCRVTREQLAVSPISVFAMLTLEGYAVGFRFNVTNRGGCDLTAESIHVSLHEATYANGTRASLSLSEGEPVLTTLMHGETVAFSYVFNSYLDFRPLTLAITIEIAFRGTGSIIVFDGEVSVPT